MVQCGVDESQREREVTKMKNYRIEYYWSQHQKYPTSKEYAATKTEARQIAARKLGHRTLRGVSTWYYESCTYFQFRRRDDSNDSPFVAIVDLAAEAAELAETAEYGDS